MCATAAGLPDQYERHDHLSGVHGWSPACGRSVGCVSQEVGCCEGDETLVVAEFFWLILTGCASSPTSSSG